VDADKRIRVGLPPWYKDLVDKRKDAEIALADCIITASELAATSYSSHIRSNIEVKAIPLGVDLERFKPDDGREVLRPQDSHFTFAFVGTARRLKGFDVLVDAVEQLLEEGLPVRLVVAGHIDGSIMGGRSRVLEIISAVGRVGQEQLASLLRRADCLVLPSRLDSFGMVVPEAMACGLPVIVSEMVGAKQLVAEGQNGFVVPVGDVSALADRMRFLVENRTMLAGMAVAARAAAEQASWPNYRRRFALTVRDLLAHR
jgi:glycosyltransferase involved in cell wall biosynthesis